MTNVVHPYAGRTAVLATMHQKQQAIAPVLQSVLGLRVTPATGLDTDQLGTFSGEIERRGTMGEVAIRKARLGMEAAGLALGMASEGSFGPHPTIPFVPGGLELLAFVDDTRGIVITESVVAESTNFAHLEVLPGGDVQPFLTRVGFPLHAVIVRPNKPVPNEHLDPHAMAKGVVDLGKVSPAIEVAAANSLDGRARIETDMRAHLNPTRMKSLAVLAKRLAQRLATLCPACATPGFGRTGTRIGLLCRDCETPTEMVAAEHFTCASCDHSEERTRRDGLLRADPGSCPECNP